MNQSVPEPTADGACLSAVPAAAGHRIPITGAWSPGVTPMAAFDAALLAAGVGNVNLVALSSIIPPSHTPARVAPSQVAEQLGWGDLTFCVMARHQADRGPVAAGLAWAAGAGRSTTSGGLFLEAHGTNAEAVRDELEAGMQAMIKSRPETDFAAPDFEIVTGESDGPSCAVVVAVFEHRPFNSPTAPREP